MQDIKATLYEGHNIQQELIQDEQFQFEYEQLLTRFSLSHQKTKNIISLESQRQNIIHQDFQSPYPNGFNNNNQRKNSSTKDIFSKAITMINIAILIGVCQGMDSQFQNVVNNVRSSIGMASANVVYLNYVYLLVMFLIYSFMIFTFMFLKIHNVRYRISLPFYSSEQQPKGLFFKYIVSVMNLEQFQAFKQVLSTLFLLSIKVNSQDLFPVTALVWMSQLMVSDNIITVWYYNGNFPHPSVAEFIQHIILFIQIFLQNRDNLINKIIAIILFVIGLFSCRTFIGYIPQYKIVKMCQFIRTALLIVLMILLPFQQFLVSYRNQQINHDCSKNFDIVHSNITKDMISFIQQPMYSNFANRTRLTWMTGTKELKTSYQFNSTYQYQTQLQFDLREQGIFFDTQAMNFSDIKLVINHHQLLELRDNYKKAQFYINFKCLRNNNQIEYLQKLLKFLQTVQWLRSQNYQFYLSLNMQPSLFLPSSLNCLEETSAPRLLDLLEGGKTKCSWDFTEYKLSSSQLLSIVKRMLEDVDAPPKSNDQKQECLSLEPKGGDYVLLHTLSGSMVQTLTVSINEDGNGVKFNDYQAPIIEYKLNQSSSVTYQDQGSSYYSTDKKQVYISKLLRKNQNDIVPNSNCTNQQAVETFSYSMEFSPTVNNSQTLSSGDKKSVGSSTKRRNYKSTQRLIYDTLARKSRYQKTYIKQVRSFDRYLLQQQSIPSQNSNSNQPGSSQIPESSFNPQSNTPSEVLNIGNDPNSLLTPSKDISVIPENGPPNMKTLPDGSTLLPGSSDVYEGKPANGDGSSNGDTATAGTALMFQADERTFQQYYLLQEEGNLQSTSKIMIDLNVIPIQKIQLPSQAGGDVCVLDSRVSLDGSQVVATTTQMMDMKVSNTTINTSFYNYNTTYILSLNDNLINTDVNEQMNNFAVYLSYDYDNSSSIDYDKYPNSLTKLMDPNGQYNGSRAFGDSYIQFHQNLQSKFDWQTSQPISVLQSPYDLARLYHDLLRGKLDDVEGKFTLLLTDTNFQLLIVCIAMFIVLSCLSLFFFMQLKPIAAFKGVYQQEFQKCFLVAKTFQ